MHHQHEMEPAKKENGYFITLSTFAHIISFAPSRCQDNIVVEQIVSAKKCIPKINFHRLAPIDDLFPIPVFLSRALQLLKLMNKRCCSNKLRVIQVSDNSVL